MKECCKEAVLSALMEFRRKIDGAYHERLTKGPRDYPPLKVLGFQDRPVYDQFIMKLLEEVEEKYKR